MAEQTPKDELNSQQLRFCEEYAVASNGRQSAIIAGYSAHTAEVQASKMLTLPKVKDRIEHLKSLLTQKAQLKAENLIEEFKSIGFANIADYLKDDMSLEDFKALPRHIATAIASVEIHTVSLGEDGGTKEIVKFKLHDKIKALDALGKNFGIYEEHNKQKSNQLNLEALSDSELLQLLSLQEKARESGSGD